MLTTVPGFAPLLQSPSLQPGLTVACRNALAAVPRFLLHCTIAVITAWICGRCTEHIDSRPRFLLHCYNRHHYSPGSTGGVPDRDSRPRFLRHYVTTIAVISLDLQAACRIIDSRPRFYSITTIAIITARINAGGVPGNALAAVTFLCHYYNRRHYSLDLRAACRILTAVGFYPLLQSPSLQPGSTGGVPNH